MLDLLTAAWCLRWHLLALALILPPALYYTRTATPKENDR